MYDMYYLPSPRNIQFSSSSILYRDPEVSGRPMKPKLASARGRSVEQAIFVRPSHSKVSSGQVDILLMQEMGTSEKRSHLISTFLDNLTSVQNLFLITKPILPSGGDGSDLDDGRTITIITGFRNNVGACTAIVPWVPLIGGDGSGTSCGYGGRGWLWSEVFGHDQNELPNPALLSPGVVHYLNLVQGIISDVVRPSVVKIPDPCPVAFRSPLR